MFREPINPHGLGPVKGTRVKILTPGCWALFAALVLSFVHLAGSAQFKPARHILLGEATGQARAFAFGPGGELFEVTAIDAKIRRWRIECGVNRAVACGPAIPGEVAALSSDGARMAVGDMAVVTLWDLAADGGKPRRSFRTHDGQTFALAFSVDGQILAAAGERAVTVWHTAPACGREMRFGITGVRSIAFAPDGRSLAVGDKAGFVRVLDLLTGRQQRAFRGHGCQVTALAFSDDSRELASASDMEKVACLWDPTTGRSLGALRGHTKRLLSLAFAPGGQTLVTSGADSTVRLWDLPTGRVRTTLRNIEVGATAVAFSPDGRSLTAGGIEPEVWVWDISRMLGP